MACPAHTPLHQWATHPSREKQRLLFISGEQVTLLLDGTCRVNFCLALGAKNCSVLVNHVVATGGKSNNRSLWATFQLPDKSPEGFMIPLTGISEGSWITPGLCRGARPWVNAKPGDLVLTNLFLWWRIAWSAENKSCFGFCITLPLMETRSHFCSTPVA